MRTRRLMVVSVAVLAAVVLSGCTEAASLVSKANIDVGLEELTTRLEEIPSVTTVTPSAEITPDLSYSVDVQVQVDELVEEDLLDVIAAVTETFAKDAFAATEELNFGLSSENGAQLSLSRPFSPPGGELQQDIHYWIALSAVYGAPLSMELAPNARVVADYNDVSEEADWAALRAVVDTSTAARRWYLGGLEFSGEFPPDAVLRLQSELRGMALGDEESAQLVGYQPGYVQVAFFPSDPGDAERPEESAGWPRVGPVVQLILDSGVALATFSYYFENAADSTIVPANVHLGVCDAELYVSPGDDALWEALAASTLDLPEGSGAGFCAPA